MGRTVSLELDQKKLSMLVDALFQMGCALQSHGKDSKDFLDLLNELSTVEQTQFK